MRPVEPFPWATFGPFDSILLLVATSYEGPLLFNYQVLKGEKTNRNDSGLANAARNEHRPQLYHRASV